LFGTPDIIPHPSPVLVFVDIFVKLKTASREPWQHFCKFAKIEILNFQENSNFGPKSRHQKTSSGHPLSPCQIASKSIDYKDIFLSNRLIKYFSSELSPVTNLIVG
jgi:hypothetical protein